MTDSLITLGRSRVQHGPSSDRVYLMKLDPADSPDICGALDALVREHGYGKIFAKVAASAEAAFMRHGYQREAAIPGFYPSGDDAVFLVRYAHAQRRRDPRAEQVTEILRLAQTQPVRPAPSLPPATDVRRLTAADLPALAGIYRQVFASYPFPIHDPAYLARTLAGDVAYFGVIQAGRLVAAASAECDRETQTAEMTDFATLPAALGQGLAGRLLARMDAERPALGIRKAYTIARALSHGMNITFARAGYVYGGTLVNNTQICGRIESMNVWYR